MVLNQAYLNFLILRPFFKCDSKTILDSLKRNSLISDFLQKTWSRLKLYCNKVIGWIKLM